MFNPDAMLARMPTRIFNEWAEFYRDEPFGEWRADLRSAIIAATVAGTVPQKKGARRPRVEDFIAQNLITPQSTAQVSDEQRLKNALTVAQMRGAKITRIHGRKNTTS